MEDFSLIEHQIRFHQGCRVDIWDDHSETYLLEFYEKEGKDWALVQSFHTIPKFSFYHLTAKKFSTEWQVRISGWENNGVKPLVVHTYSHYNKNILLILESDRYKDHFLWVDSAASMKRKYNCSITVVSKFKTRMREQTNVTVLEEIPKNYESDFYSSFVIGRDNSISQFKEIFSISYLPKTLGSPLTNGSSPYYSSSHRNNFIRMSPEEIFKDIMNI